MITYEPFWQTLKSSHETTYSLITKHHISSATIQKLRDNKPMNTTTLNDLCVIFKCDISDIAKYTFNPEDQLLELNSEQPD